LEVSTRTIKRDVSALQQGGLPIQARSGPGGGYILDSGATLPPVNLTPAQAVAVAVALAAHQDAPYSLDGRVALEKVLDVMDPGARQRAERLAERVWIRGGSGQHTAVAAAVEQALAEQRVVILDYRDQRGVSSRRPVEPHLIAHTDNHWYVVAWCRLRHDERWFRWDRIEGAQLTAQRFPGRDLAVFGSPPPDARPIR
jgi:predicted DNA-binding transcriptional regulator YafY